MAWRSLQIMLMFFCVSICLCATPDIAVAQSVDQPGLVAQYDLAVAVQNAAIDVLSGLSKKSADPAYQKIISAGGDSIAAGTESLAAARVNVAAAGTTAGIYVQAIRDGRIQDAQTAASLWGKQAGLARDHLKTWGQELSAALASFEAAKRWLSQ